jgi:hypothetical protein
VKIACLLSLLLPLTLAMPVGTATAAQEPDPLSRLDPTSRYTVEVLMDSGSSPCSSWRDLSRNSRPSIAPEINRTGFIPAPSLPRTAVRTPESTNRTHSPAS